MADPLRDRIAAELRSMYDGRKYADFDGDADAILAIVREHATSDAAVEAALVTWLDSARGEDGDMRAAIEAALGGGA